MNKTNVNPNGERKNMELLSETSLIPVDAFGGRVHVRWDDQAAVTLFGQLALFIEFLRTGGV